jgi:hypothetical protein
VRFRPVPDRPRGALNAGSGTRREPRALIAVFDFRARPRASKQEEFRRSPGTTPDRRPQRSHSTVVREPTATNAAVTAGKSIATPSTRTQTPELSATLVGTVITGASGPAPGPSTELRRIGSGPRNRVAEDQADRPHDRRSHATVSGARAQTPETRAPCQKWQDSGPDAFAKRTVPKLDRPRQLRRSAVPRPRRLTPAART